MANIPTLDTDIVRGNKGKKVKEIQEWLCLHGCLTGIDGDFGPATETEVKAFQKKAGLPQTGIVNTATFEAMIQPLRAVLEPIAPGNRSLGAMTVAYARQHLKQHPMEIGGQNMGPWVRLYMGGREGHEWRWCAGFTCFVLQQACEALSITLPIRKSFSCDTIAVSAEAGGLLLRQPGSSDRAAIKPGTLFLTRRTSTDWTHIGIVTKRLEETFETIEGNTNDNVAARVRSYANRDFICLE